MINIAMLKQEYCISRTIRKQEQLIIKAEKGSIFNIDSEYTDPIELITDHFWSPLKVLLTLCAASYLLAFVYISTAALGIPART